MHRKFDPARRDILNDPERLKMLDVDILWKAFGVEMPGTVIDVGAGTGFFAIQFLPRLREGGRLYACDISEQMISWMEDHLSAEQRKAIVPLKVGESSIGLPDGIADLVYMINVFHELDDPRATLGEVRRLLTSGGRLAVVDWKKEEMSQGPPLEHRVDGDTVVRRLKACRFTGVRRSDALPFHHIVTGKKPNQ